MLDHLEEVGGSASGLEGGLAASFYKLLFGLNRV